MNHLTEEQLILHYYGEETDAQGAGQHLENCAECREHYGALQRVLNVVDSAPVPECGPEYGAAVWARLEPQLPARRWWTRWAGPAPIWQWASMAASVAVLLSVGIFAGRLTPVANRPGAADADGRQRVLRVAVGDYLDRSQLVLTELANAGGPLDISAEQASTQDLLSETRLYRQTAARTGDMALAGMLDDMERLLLDIAHSPSQLSAAEVEQLRRRLDSGGIIFKIRVVNSHVAGGTL
jgi:hypothetical protein